MIIADTAFEIFKYFRLGGSAKSQTKCLYSAKENGATTKVVIERCELPPKKSNAKRFVIVSDTHERHAKIGTLPEGDFFIHCGDIFMTSRMLSTEGGKSKLEDFNKWLGEHVPCTTKIVIAGNHDMVVETIGKEKTKEILSNAIYLENSFVEVQNGSSRLTLFGTPASRGKSSNRAFQSKAFHLERQSFLAKRNADVDILITHGPYFDFDSSDAAFRPKLVVFGHAHCYHGVYDAGDILWGRPVPYLTVNASIMDGNYNPRQLPIVLDITWEDSAATSDRV